MKKQTIIILSSLIAVLILYIVEQVMVMDYITKTGIKLFLFILIPVIYFKLVKRQSLKEALHLKRLSFHQVRLGLILGVLSFVIVILSYLLFKDLIEVDAIMGDLKSKNITKETFIYIGLYITFINAFLEEFFFRGYLFLNLYEEGKKRLAYFYSAGLFAGYHIVIFQTWFNIYLILLALIGLFTIGIVFNYINTKSKNFLNSYIVHVLADIAVILIGFSLFQLI